MNEGTPVYPIRAKRWPEVSRSQTRVPLSAANLHVQDELHVK